MINALRNFKYISAELDRMENCEEYQYINSLNIFSMTLGPFDKELKKDISPIEKEQIERQKSKDETIIGVTHDSSKRE